MFRSCVALTGCLGIFRSVIARFMSVSECVIVSMICLSVCFVGRTAGQCR